MPARDRPDPTDEPRGVSRYMRAVAGEPDLDRIIRLQPAHAVPRSHCPPIGVRVSKVVGDPRAGGPHPVGAAVDLLDSPRFEGRNHATAADGYEAVSPFHLRMTKNRFAVRRRFSDRLTYPPSSPADTQAFAQLKSTGINFSSGEIADAIDILDLARVWAERCRQLQADLGASTDPVGQAALRSRIASMTIMDSPNGPNPRPANAKYFGARMLYPVRLSGESEVTDPDGFLTGAPAAAVPSPPPKVRHSSRGPRAQGDAERIQETVIQSTEGFPH